MRTFPKIFKYGFLISSLVINVQATNDDQNLSLRENSKISNYSGNKRVEQELNNLGLEQIPFFEPILPSLSQENLLLPDENPELDELLKEFQTYITDDDSNEKSSEPLFKKQKKETSKAEDIYEYLNPENFDKNWESIIEPALNNVPRVRETSYDKEFIKVLYWARNLVEVEVIPESISNAFKTIQKTTIHKIYNRYYRWKEKGTLNKFLDALKKQHLTNPLYHKDKKLQEIEVKYYLF